MDSGSVGIGCEKHGAVMHLYIFLYDGKPYAGALFVIFDSARGLVVTLEHEGNLLFWDAHSRICHINIEMFGLFIILQREHDAAMLWGKLACIGQQVVQDGFHFKDIHTSINVLSISIENKIQLLALYILSIRIENAAREFYELYFGRNEGLLYLFSVLISFNSEMDKRTQLLGIFVY